MKTRQQHYNELMAVARNAAFEGEHELVQAVCALCQEIRMGMKHNWDESVMTAEALIEAVRAADGGLAKSTAINEHGHKALMEAVASGTVELKKYGSGFKVVLVASEEDLTADLP